MTNNLRMTLGLAGGGWHPAAWREPGARPGELLTAGWWADQIREAQDALIDLVTIDDALALQSSDPDGPDDRTDAVRGRLDAVVLAARLAPVTSGIGIAPVVSTTLTEPFHVSTQLATIDFVSRGRAAWLATISPSRWEAAARRPAGAAVARGAARGGARARRGRAPAVGLVGGRRGDPRRGAPPLRRPLQAAPHRLRRRPLRHPRAVDHAAPAAGPAARPRDGAGHRRGRRADRPRRVPRRVGGRRGRAPGAAGRAAPVRARRTGLHRHGGRARGPRSPSCPTCGCCPPRSPTTCTRSRASSSPSSRRAACTGASYGAGTLRERWGFGRPASRFAA